MSALLSGINTDAHRFKRKKNIQYHVLINYLFAFEVRLLKLVIDVKKKNECNTDSKKGAVEYLTTSVTLYLCNFY